MGEKLKLSVVHTISEGWELMMDKGRMWKTRSLVLLRHDVTIQ
jgi:hypothetical protein